MAKNMYEIFDEFEAAKTKNEKIEVLQKNKNFALTNVLMYAFDPNIHFVFDKMPYYKAEDVPPGMSYSSIHHELDRMYLLIKDHPRASPNLTMQRREQLLIQMLEALEPREAIIFINMILKNLKIKGLDAKIVKEAFPGLLPE